MNNDKVIVKDSVINGKGVFALKSISKGELILPIDDSRIVTVDSPLDASQGELEYHCDYLKGGKIVLMQFPERHINHSCDPNAFVKTILRVRYVFALRPINVGEEITYDYCINGFGDTLWKCNCGSPRCRKIIHSDFFHLPYELQVEYLPLLDDWYIEEYRDKVRGLLENVP
ncbi:MAG TPA: SET domain-containing protein-lysine N-methyltransferase [Anaerolineales bacterium]|nr:SET domain-containing protein-lysine N-methyltransferase [Anaerolineales bacterium]